MIDAGDAPPVVQTGAQPNLPGFVLVVDDQASARRGVARLVEQVGGVPAVQVGTVGQALARLPERCLLAIVVDMVLPDGSGQAIVEAAKHRHGRPMPVLVVTGYAGFANAARLSGVKYAEKPDHAPCVAHFIEEEGVPRWSRLLAAVLATGVPLSPQPLRVLLLAGIGVGRAEVRLELGIEESTLVSHITIVLRWYRKATNRGAVLLEDVVAGLLGAASPT